MVEIAISFAILVAVIFLVTPIIALFVHSKVSFWHSLCVAINSAKLAKAMGQNSWYVSYAFLNGLYHDVGKILVSKNALHKNGKLTDEEWKEMKSHASNWVARIYGVIFPACIGHHKDFAGTGYGAEKIQSSISAIVEICDVHNAISGWCRTYRELTPLEDVVSMLEGDLKKGKFDPDVFAAFMELVEGLSVPYVVKRADEKMRNGN